MPSHITTLNEVVKSRRPYNKREIKKRLCHHCGKAFFARDRSPSECQYHYCSYKCSRVKAKQVPGEVFLFKCGHSVVLPVKLGERNNLVTWIINKKITRGGHWCCKVCLLVARKKDNLGEGKQGLLGRIKRLVYRINTHSKSRGYAGITDSPDHMLQMWKSQNGKCAACRKEISFSGGDCNVDHSHVTGKVRGFICRTCNVTEGNLKGYTSGQLDNLCSYLRRHIGEAEAQERVVGAIHDTKVGSFGNPQSGWSEQKRQSA